MAVPKVAATLSLVGALSLFSDGPGLSAPPISLSAAANPGARKVDAVQYPYATGYPAYGYGYYHYDGSYYPYAGYGYDATRYPAYYYRPYWRRYGYGWHRPYYRRWY